MPRAVFDFHGGMYGILFAVQNLTLGATGALAAVSDVTNVYDVVPYKVVGRERIRAASRGDVEAWVVEVGDPVGLERLPATSIAVASYLVSRRWPEPSAFRT